MGSGRGRMMRWRRSSGSWRMRRRRIGEWEGKDDEVEEE